MAPSLGPLLGGGQCSTFNSLQVAVQFSAIMLVVACSGAYSEHIHVCQLPGNLDRGVTCHNQMCAPLPCVGCVSATVCQLTNRDKLK